MKHHDIMKPIVSLSIPQCWKPTFGTASWDVSCTVFHPRICDARHTKCQQAIFVLSLFCRCILAPNRLTNLRRQRTVRAPKCCKFSGKREVQTQKCCKYRWNGSLQVQNAASSKENEQNSTLRKIPPEKIIYSEPFCFVDLWHSMNQEFTSDPPTIWGVVTNLVFVVTSPDGRFDEAGGDLYCWTDEPPSALTFPSEGRSVWSCGYPYSSHGEPRSIKSLMIVQGPLMPLMPFKILGF